ncbi:hypothetical protein KAT08_02510 [Candidatus Babeliales bacterium]|nr:hypothetical protein [Candidatus Babeliales bacterium]
MSKMVRISEETSTNLTALQKSTGKSKVTLVEIAIDKLYKDFFLLKANRAYEKLKKNKKKWNEELKERESWENTSNDGLINNE